VLYVQAAAETLPAELDAIADQLVVNFPWGSLLRGVVGGDQAILSNLRKLCKADAILNVVISIDPLKDRSENLRLGLPEIDERYLRETLPSRYAKAGFTVLEIKPVAENSWTQLRTSWAKRLRSGPTREFFRIVARAI
jgi:16S rRNA (adenine(1408)-N(1))-methyltransferase